MARSRHKVALGQRMTLAQHRRAWESRPLPPAKRGDDGRHSLHHVVSRICTLPPRLARHLLLTYSDPGSNVLDPFCGKGTIPVEACLQVETDSASIFPLKRLRPLTQVYALYPSGKQKSMSYKRPRRSKKRLRNRIDLL